MAVQSSGVPSEPAAARSRRRFRLRLPWSGRHLTWRRVLVLGGLVLLVAVGGYAVRLGWSIWSVQNEIYHPLPPTPTWDVRADVEGLILPTVGPGTATEVPFPTITPWPTLAPGRVNILLLGTDKRPDDVAADASRSDTIILFSIDTLNNTVGMLNIPRDLLVTVPGWGKRKVNAAYAIGEFNKLPGGGPALAVGTVSHFLGVPIDYYLAINFQGFEKVVDTVGGIWINVPAPLDDPCYPTANYGCEVLHFDAGYQFMDGARALKYARTRHADSDFGRSLRQQQVILAVRQQALRLDLLPRLPDLIDQFGGMVETNIPFPTQLAFGRMAGNLQSSQILTAQIDSTMVTEVTDPYEGWPSTALALNWTKATPMLDAFFGRGVALRGFSVSPPTPLVETPAAATREPAVVPTPAARPRVPAPRSPTAQPRTIR